MTKLKSMTVSFIATILNEEKTIEQLLVSLLKQTKKPDEVIIVDGGSTDKTIAKIKNFQKKHPSLNLKLIVKNGANRAQGRNLAIQEAKNEIIAISDAGCQLDKKWLENITRPFQKPKTEVVAGYFHAQAKNIFEECNATFTLTVPHRINPKTFLPASRSMAIRKSTWKKAGGFPENFPDNEDFVFAHKLKKLKAEIVFCPEAIVYWRPRSTVKSFWLMIYRFARGDAFAGLRTLKTTFIIGRSFLGIAMVYFSLKHPKLIPITAVLVLAYFLWPLIKNYRYIKKWPAVFLLPFLQMLTDSAIVIGTLHGIKKKIVRT